METSGIKQAILFNITQIIANVVAWFIVAPTLDIVIYMDPAKRFIFKVL